MKITDYTNIREEQYPFIGGKAKGLHELSKYGYNVPPFFIIEDLTKEDYPLVLEYFKKSDLNNVSVRSSANNEDGKDYSFAGQYETVLNVQTEEEFIDALDKCLASLENIRSSLYSSTFAQNGKELKMTIVVQEMINADYAGVIFTKNPLNKEETLIEMVNGIGESLVSGTNNATQYFVTDKEIIKKGDPLVDFAFIRELKNIVDNMEKDFGYPLDIEFAIKDNDIYFLQARPITINEEVPIDEFDIKEGIDDLVITTCNVRECMPKALTPLSLSSSGYALDYGIRQTLVDLRAYKKMEDIPPYTCLMPFSNSMLFNLTPLYVLGHRVYLANKEGVDIAICGRILNECPDAKVKNTFFIKRLFNTIKFFKFISSGEPAKIGIEKELEKIQFDLTKSKEDIYHQITRNLDILNNVLYYHYWCSYYSGSKVSTIVIALTKDFKDKNELISLLAGCLQNIDGVESFEMLKALEDLAKSIYTQYPFTANFNREQMVEHFSNLDGVSKEKYDAFLLRHGHRGICEMEIRNQSFASDLSILADNIIVSISSLKNNCKKDNPPTYEEALEKFLGRYKGAKKKIFKGFVDGAREAVYYREYSKSKTVLAIDRIKYAYRALANLLVKENYLPDPDLIYFLTHQEIQKLMNEDFSLIKKAMARRRLYPLQNEIKYQEINIGKPKVITKSEIDPNAKVYQGLPASVGIAKGKVRIIRSVEDANKLIPGEIMVAGYSDIGWSPYYGIISGLVCEIGSSLSHGIVVAREYALPTVCNVPGILDALKDGDVITINGNKGTITVER